LFQHSTQAVPTSLRVMMLTTRGSGAPVFLADSIIAVICGVFLKAGGHWEWLEPNIDEWGQKPEEKVGGRF
jgi:hypothetical protein